MVSYNTKAQYEEACTAEQNRYGRERARIGDFGERAPKLWQVLVVLFFPVIILILIASATW